MYISKTSSLVFAISNGHLIVRPCDYHYHWEFSRAASYLSSLYRGYPSGSFTFWCPSNPPPNGVEKAPDGRQYIVDGLQRITAIYGAMMGMPPPFFAGAECLDWRVYFHLAREEFSRLPHHDDFTHDPYWIDLAAFYQKANGAAAVLDILFHHSSPALPMDEIARRVTSLRNIQDRSIPIEFMPPDITLTDLAEYRALAAPKSSST